MDIDLKSQLLPDPGCKTATDLFDELPPQEELNDLHMPALILIETHRGRTINHAPDCFINRTIN